MRFKNTISFGRKNRLRLTSKGVRYEFQVGTTKQLLQRPFSVSVQNFVNHFYGWSFTYKRWNGIQNLRSKLLYSFQSHLSNRRTLRKPNLWYLRPVLIKINLRFHAVCSGYVLFASSSLMKLWRFWIRVHVYASRYVYTLVIITPRVEYLEHC